MLSGREGEGGKCFQVVETLRFSNEFDGFS